MSAIVTRIEDFSERVTKGLDKLTWLERRQIIRTLVARVVLSHEIRSGISQRIFLIVFRGIGHLYAKHALLDYHYGATRTTAEQRTVLKALGLSDLADNRYISERIQTR